MTTQERKITDKEYVEEAQAFGAWVLVEKDMLPEKTSGGIILSDKGRDNRLKMSATGYIRGMAPRGWPVFEQPHDYFWHHMLREGDHIGFSCTTPMSAPAPHAWQFVDENPTNSKWVKIVFTDIMTIFLHTKEQRKEFENRMTEWRKNHG